MSYESAAQPSPSAPRVEQRLRQRGLCRVHTGTNRAHNEQIVMRRFFAQRGNLCVRRFVCGDKFVYRRMIAAHGFCQRMPNVRTRIGRRQVLRLRHDHGKAGVLSGLQRQQTGIVAHQSQERRANSAASN